VILASAERTSTGPKEAVMSFSQQSGSDRAAAEADARRKQLGDRPVRSSDRSAAIATKSSGGVVAWFRLWVRRVLAR
jgi:hypothetical protein